MHDFVYFNRKFIGRFSILKNALSVMKDDASSSFLYLRRIIRLDELGQTFVVRLFMRLSSVKTGTRRSIRLNELFFEMHLERDTTRDS